MLPDLLKLFFVEWSTGAFFKKLAELFRGALFVVESACRGLGSYEQAAVDVVGHFLKKCGVDRLSCLC